MQTDRLSRQTSPQVGHSAHSLRTSADLLLYPALHCFLSRIGPAKRSHFLTRALHPPSTTKPAHSTALMSAPQPSSPQLHSSSPIPLHSCAPSPGKNTACLLPTQHPGKKVRSLLPQCWRRFRWFPACAPLHTSSTDSSARRSMPR